MADPEKTELSPIKPDGQEVSIQAEGQQTRTKDRIPAIGASNEVELSRVRTEHLIAQIRHYGGVGLLIAITLVCLYIMVCDNTGAAYADAAKLIFLVSGGIVGSLYASTR